MAITAIGVTSGTNCWSGHLNGSSNQGLATAEVYQSKGGTNKKMPSAGCMDPCSKPKAKTRVHFIGQILHTKDPTDPFKGITIYLKNSCGEDMPVILVLFNLEQARYRIVFKDQEILVKKVYILQVSGNQHRDVTSGALLKVTSLHTSERPLLDVNTLEINLGEYNYTTLSSNPQGTYRTFFDKLFPRLMHNVTAIFPQGESIEGSASFVQEATSWSLDVGRKCCLSTPSQTLRFGRDEVEEPPASKNRSLKSLHDHDLVKTILPIGVFLFIAILATACHLYRKFCGRIARRNTIWPLFSGFSPVVVLAQVMATRKWDQANDSPPAYNDVITLHQVDVTEDIEELPSYNEAIANMAKTCLVKD